MTRFVPPLSLLVVAAVTGLLIGTVLTGLGVPFALTMVVDIAAGFALGYFWPQP